MPVRVEFIDAIEDLKKCREAGTLHLFLKKLVSLEENGKSVGLPLGRDLTGAYKIVVGDRNWRIVFAMNPEETVATVWVAGDRDDSECYDLARRRTQKLARTNRSAASLAAVMLQLNTRQQTDKRKRK